MGNKKLVYRNTANYKRHNQICTIVKYSTPVIIEFEDDKHKMQASDRTLFDPKLFNPKDLKSCEQVLVEKYIAIRKRDS